MFVCVKIAWVAKRRKFVSKQPLSLNIHFVFIYML